MPDATQSDPEADNRLLRPPEVLPDLATCRVADAGLGGYFYCLGAWGWLCPHCLSYGFSQFCLHSTAPAILARSTEEP